MGNTHKDVFRDVFRSLQPYSSLYGFSQNNGATSTNLIDFTSRITWSATNMKLPEPATSVASTRYRCWPNISKTPMLGSSTPFHTPPPSVHSGKAPKSVYEPLHIKTGPEKLLSYLTPPTTDPHRCVIEKGLLPEMYQGVPLFRTAPDTRDMLDNFRGFGFSKSSIKLSPSATETGKVSGPGQSPVLEQCYLKEQRRYQCPRCEVTCANKGQFKGHLRVHTGERPFKCDHFGCSRAFARNEELTRHRRIHTGHRPHVCPLCGKDFGRKDHLNKHVKTHLNAQEKKTCVCPVLGCMQRYSRSDALARHQWNVHGIKTRSRAASRVQ
ncbi:early growth response protein 1-B [Lingula anatina]|uniref:Early growth response protein 1-B n=1 Tax=Lingula anatina TaxID=7574 RepID=A0A1S3K8T0_LINAN|nr:early growth response protein 1-B [Lingula anatina]|eukprot:XP_013419033.1 early growth response protein 1-B [Lingula anatina]